MSPTLTAHGLSASVLPGWDVRIEQRRESTVAAPASDAPVGGYVHPVLHAATTRLPLQRGDFGSGCVETMTGADVFVSLVEFDHEAGATRALRAGQPASLRSADFHPDAQQRVIAGMCGTQRFFPHNGRAFCLYVVLGSWTQRAQLVPIANGFIATIEIAAR